MFRLRVLGGAVVERADGTPLANRATQRHRVALLALLASAPSGLSRDKLIGVLWPESDRERGRNLLNVSVYELRKALGDEAILSSGDDLRLNPEVVRSDIAELEAAVERQDHEAAVALYRGPLLDGFFVDDAPEFERWADRERDRLAGIYARELEALAEAASARGEHQRAAEWWKRRAVHDPYDARVALCLMRALDASGNRAGALQHAAIHERLLQQEMDLSPSAEVVALTERLRSEPMVASAVQRAPEPTSLPSPKSLVVARADDAAPPASAEVVQARTVATASRARRRLARTGALVLLCAGGIVALALILRPTPPKPERSVAVLPFVNMSPEGDNEFFSDGMTEEIITQLSIVPSLKVISRTSAMRYKGSGKSLREIAGELRVGHVLEGSVRREGNQVRITAQLIDAATDHHLWSQSYDRQLVDIFAVQEEIAREVGRALEVELGEAKGSLARGTRDPETYELYRRGRFLWGKRTREAHEQAVQYYHRAIERDSSYADPYSGLADAYLTAYQFNLTTLTEAQVYSQLKWAADRALALDDRSADAHASSAVALWWQRDWSGAERELRRAIELNPGHVTARGWYALLLSGMGRVEEGVQQVRRISELDPLAMLSGVNHAWLCYVARDYDCALEQSARALEINNAWPPTYVTLSLIYAQKGMDSAATRAASKAVELGGRQISSALAGLAYAHAVAGRRAEAVQFLQRAKADPWEGFNIARVHIALGELDSAFVWLDRSSWKWPHRAVRADPALDPLRSDPRFKRLSERVDKEMGTSRAR
jgi:TolB-like protein/DNA-binding SARP family transcriptional activator/Tfp pilus assembly protein PilF